MANSHSFCRMLLQQARKDALNAPKGLHAWKAPFGEYEVRDNEGNLIWAGQACCKWNARVEALLKFCEE